MAENQTANKPMLYVVDVYHLCGDIKPYYIVKETEKQYIVSDKDPDAPRNERLWRSEYTVKKADMRRNNLRFAKTEAAAHTMRRELIRGEIHRKEWPIECLQKDIKALKQILSEVYNEQ